MVQARFQINKERIQNVILNKKINGKCLRRRLRSRSQQQLRKDVMLKGRITWQKTEDGKWEDRQVMMIC
jgi:hypothetical protein